MGNDNYDNAHPSMKYFCQRRGENRRHNACVDSFWKMLIKDIVTIYFAFFHFYLKKTKLFCSEIIFRARRSVTGYTLRSLKNKNKTRTFFFLNVSSKSTIVHFWLLITLPDCGVWEHSQSGIYFSWHEVTAKVEVLSASMKKCQLIKKAKRQKHVIRIRSTTLEVRALLPVYVIRLLNATNTNKNNIRDENNIVYSNSLWNFVGQQDKYFSKKKSIFEKRQWKQT